MEFNIQVIAEFPSVAVSVTCHDAYRHLLQDQIWHVNNQTMPPDEKFICLDTNDQEWVNEVTNQNPEWTIFGGNFKGPNSGRNIVANTAKSTWIIYADADDTMHRDYVLSAKKAIKAAGDRCGIIYADIIHSSGSILRTPEKFDYWKLRLRNYISACSAWRKEAIFESGGWMKTKCYDDWAIAHKITALGWGAVKNQVPIHVKDHAGTSRRSYIGTGAENEFKKLARSYGIVTLLAGREKNLRPWAKWLMNAWVPERCSLYIVNNSNSREFSSRLETVIYELVYIDKFKSVNISKSNIKFKNIDEFSRHRHVPMIYNSILPSVHEDILVTLEDDVVPPLDGLQKMIDAFPCREKVGGMSAVYPSRSGNGRIVAAFGPVRNGGNYWSDSLFEKDIAGIDGCIDVGFIGGGFCLFHNALVKRSMPMRFGLWDGQYASGWDSNLSRNIRNLGYKIKLNCGVRCEHNFS